MLFTIIKRNIDFLKVKWLGKDAISALAIDGKGGKAEMLEKVARWVAAGGRNVSQPGEQVKSVQAILLLTMISSHDRIL